MPIVVSNEQERQMERAGFKWWERILFYACIISGGITGIFLAIIFIFIGDLW